MLLLTYCNLQKNCLSTLHASGPRYGRLFRHADTVLIRNAVFRVQPAGHRKAVEARQRNVHAMIKGDSDLDRDVSGYLSDGKAVRVRYNPFVHGFFFRADNESPVKRADLVILRGKEMFAINPVAD